MMNNYNSSNKEKQMFSATCSQCGKACMVPFKPTGDKPVYCPECFNKKKESGKLKGGRPNINMHTPRGTVNNASGNNFDTKRALMDINDKLDRLINLLDKTKPTKTETLKEVLSKATKAPTKKTASKKKTVAKKKK